MEISKQIALALVQSKKKRVKKRKTDDLQEILTKLDSLTGKVERCVADNQLFKVKFKKLNYLELDVDDAVASSSSSTEIPLPKGKKATNTLLTSWLYPNVIIKLKEMEERVIGHIDEKMSTL